VIGVQQLHKAHAIGAVALGTGVLTQVIGGEVAEQVKLLVIIININLRELVEHIFLSRTPSPRHCTPSLVSCSSVSCGTRSTEI